MTIIEDDTPGVTLSTDALELPEGDSQSYTVVLDTEPTADVTVVVAVPENAEVAVDETTLTFTADNWNTPQIIEVTAAHDDDAVADEPAVLEHTIRGGDYEDVTAAEVEVTITEDDTAEVTLINRRTGTPRRRLPKLYSGAGHRTSGRCDGRNTGA